MNIYSLLILECCIWATATLCTPSITKGSYNQEPDGHIYLKCDISSCSRVSRIIFEKNSVDQPDHWTPVFEGINALNYTALDTSEDYSLTQRSFYIALPNYHTLYINPLTTEDIGLWRCVAYRYKRRIESTATHIGSICKPILSDGIPSMDKFKQIECEVSTCSSVSNLRFEKIIYNQKQWTPVYEKNETHHQPLVTNLSHYSLRNRSIYKNDHYKHILYINPLTLGDHGKWRCVVYDIKGFKYASKAMDINIYVTPPDNLTIVPPSLELTTSQTTEFMCMTDGIHPVPDVLWIVNGTDKYTGTQSNKKHADGLWSVMNIITLSFNKVGLSNLSCIMRTNERDRWMQNQIRIIVKDTKNGNRPVTTLSYDINSTPSNINVNILNSPLFLTITYSGICAFGLLLVILTLWQVGKRVKGILQRILWFGRQQRKDEYGIVRKGRKKCKDEECGILHTGRKKCKDEECGILHTVLDIQFPDSPKSAIFTQTFEMEERICSIWRSTHSDCVFVGGYRTPSITVVSSVSEKTSHRLPKGTCIVHGLFITTTTHVINVYNATWNTHSIYCVHIDPLHSTELTILGTLKLSHEITKPRCIFAIDTSSIGIYCARKRMIDVFDITCITKPSHDGTIKLNGYDADQNDALCMNPKDHICVLSYKYHSVYIYNKNGEFIYTFNTGMWYDPVDIQTFSDNSMAVVNLYGEIHLFGEDTKSKIINLRENTYVQAAVFTSSLLWFIDALDNTKIHVFKTGPCVK